VRDGNRPGVEDEMKALTKPQVGKQIGWNSRGAALMASELVLWKRGEGGVVFIFGVVNGGRNVRADDIISISRKERQLGAQPLTRARIAEVLSS
jgi:hypothetical protein